MESFIAFIFAYMIFFIFLWAMAQHCGVPDRLTDVYYQMEKRKSGWVFSLLLFLVAISTGVALCDLRVAYNNMLFAVLGSFGLLFLALILRFFEKQFLYRLRNVGVVISFICLGGWCINVYPYPTFVFGGMFVLYLICIDIAKRANRMWHIEQNCPRFHPWYWAGVASLLDVFATYIIARMFL